MALQTRGSTNNTATLIQVLSSPLLLAPIERSLGLPEGAIVPTITIPKGATGMGPPGVLEVALQWGDPVEGKAILEKISKEYLTYSLRQRQEKLTQGLAFLDQQAPELQARVTALQNQLADFRQSTGFVEPLEQAALIKEQQTALSTQRKELEQEQARLEGQAAALRRGHFSVTSTQAFNPGLTSLSQEGSAGKDLGKTQGGSGQTTLSDDLFEVERQLAEAEATFTDDAPQVQELRAKRAKLRPLLQRQQLSPILASLNENRSQLAEIRLQQEQLARQFQGNPAQMKQYEALQQKLEVARDNLTSYIKARESFRLQVAQRTVPWKVMVQPRFGPRPVKPSVPRGLL
ncbi:MAG: GumC family protein, partial [Cyanobium sp.]